MTWISIISVLSKESYNTSTSPFDKWRAFLRKLAQIDILKKLFDNQIPGHLSEVRIYLLEGNVDLLRFKEKNKTCLEIEDCFVYLLFCCLLRCILRVFDVTFESSVEYVAIKTILNLINKIYLMYYICTYLIRISLY